MTMSTERIFHPDAPQGIQPPAVHTHLPRFGLIVVGDERSEPLLLTEMA